MATLDGSIFAFNAGDITPSGGTGAGDVVWSRTTQTTAGAGKTNYLWFDDCQGLAPGVSTTFRKAGLPFAGIVSTPVIDTAATPDPVLYVTSLCQTGASQSQQWWIHQIDLYTGYDVAAHQEISASVAGYDGADNISGGNIPFVGWQQLQRSALLKVSLSGASWSPLVYFTFGFASGGEITTPYHGWVFGYDSGLNQRIAFNASTKGYTGNSDSPSCTASCSECIFLSCPPSGCTHSPYEEMANWCGHGGGTWMSSRGGAANQDPRGTTHACYGVGNGPFQQNTADTTLYNWGQSVLDFTATSTGFASSPTEYFTPNGNATGGGQIPVTPPEGGSAYTYQGMNQNDFDMAVSGVMLYTDSGSNQWLLTFDKAGYGYLLRQANLCGDTTDETPQCFPGVSTGYPGFATGDPGNAFPLAGNKTQCGNLEGDTSCDRITSLAFDPDSSPQRLYLWPSNETLTSIESSNNQAIEPGGATIGSNGATICGSGTSFTTWLVPGDALIDEGSANSGQSRIVTGITSNTQITVSQAFTTRSGPARLWEPTHAVAAHCPTQWVIAAGS